MATKIFNYSIATKGPNGEILPNNQVGYGPWESLDKAWVGLLEIFGSYLRFPAGLTVGIIKSSGVLEEYSWTSGGTSVEDFKGKGTSETSIEIREDGYWYVNGEKLPYRAIPENGERGQDGKTPYIGENGNWWIDGRDTKVRALGVTGPQGPRGPQGVAGPKGQDGAPGGMGVGISEIIEYYLASPSPEGVSRETPGWSTGIPSIDTVNMYLWNYEEIRYSDGTRNFSNPIVIGFYGTEGKGIEAIKEYYLASPLRVGVTVEGQPWTLEPQEISPEKPYLWNYEEILWSTKETTQTPPIILGHWGADAETTVIVDLTNEVDCVTLDQDGLVSKDYILETEVSVWFGSKNTLMEAIRVLPEDLPEGCTFTGDNLTGKVSLGIPSGIPFEKLSLPIYIDTELYGTKKCVFTVQPLRDGQDSVQYSLEPSIRQIRYDAFGELIGPKTISCKVKKTVGPYTSYVSLVSDPGVINPPFLYVSIDNGRLERIETSQEISLEGCTFGVSFKVQGYLEGTSQDIEKIIFDSESIPVIKDGRDASPVEVGDDGYLYIDGVSTGIHPISGDTIVSVGDDGFLYVNGSKTGIAEGAIDEIIVSDLSNEIESITLEESGELSGETHCSTSIIIYAGSEDLNITSLEWPDMTGICEVSPETYTHSGETYYTGKVTITLGAEGMTRFFDEDKIVIPLTAKASWKGKEYTRKSNFVIQGFRKAAGSSPSIYSLSPSEKTIRKIGDVIFPSTRKIKVDAYKTTGDLQESLEGLDYPVILYRIDNKGSWQRSYPGDEIEFPDDISIRLQLRLQNTSEITSDTILFDSEDIPVLVDGVNGQGVYTQYLFKWSKVKPGRLDSSYGTWATSSPGLGDSWEGWTDGVSGDRDSDDSLWITSRRFTTDGVDQDPLWSEPGLIGDQADQDVCYSSLMGEDGQAPGNLPIEGDGTLSDNTTWHSTPLSSDIWQATSWRTQGLWQPWKITRIQGESPIYSFLQRTSHIITLSPDGTIDRPYSFQIIGGMVKGNTPIEGVRIEIPSEALSGFPGSISRVSQGTLSVTLTPGGKLGDEDIWTLPVILSATGYESSQVDFIIQGVRKGEAGSNIELNGAALGVYDSIEALKGAFEGGSLLPGVYLFKNGSKAYWKELGTTWDNNATEAPEGVTYVVSGSLWVSSGSYWTNCGQIKGEAGEKGTSISRVENFYKWSPSGQNPGEGEWTQTVPEAPKGMPYLWNYEVTYWSDSTPATETTPNCISYLGQDGIGISEITEYYTLTETSGIPEFSRGDWETTPPQTSQEKRFLWNVEVTTFSDGSEKITDPCCIGVEGLTGESVTVEYSEDRLGWHSSYQDGDVWMRTNKNLTAVKIKGEDGRNGSYVDYKFSNSATLKTASSGVAPSDAVWTDTPPDPQPSKPYLWSKQTPVDPEGIEGTPKYIRITGEPLGSYGILVSPEFFRESSVISTTTAAVSINKIVGSQSERVSTQTDVKVWWKKDQGSWNQLVSLADGIPMAGTKERVDVILISSKETLGGKEWPSCVVYDSKTITVVKDGTSVFQVDLGNETSGIPVTEEGKTISGENITIPISAHYGTTPVSLVSSNLEFSVWSEHLEYSSGKITLNIPQGTTLESIQEIPVKVSKEGYPERTVVFSLLPVKVGKSGQAAVVYDLIPDKSQIILSRDQQTGLLEESQTLKVEIRKTSGGVTTGASTEEVDILYSFTGSPSSIVLESGVARYDSSEGILVTSDKSQVFLTAFSKGGVILDKETIPVIKETASYYSWIRYSDNASGEGLYEVPVPETQYIGLAVNKVSPEPSGDPSDYTWSRFKGADGVGEKGDDGVTYYTWIRYANDGLGEGISDSPKGKKYIGLAYNKLTPEESSDPTDYSWSLIQGENAVSYEIVPDPSSIIVPSEEDHAEVHFSVYKTNGESRSIVSTLSQEYIWAFIGGSWRKGSNPGVVTLSRPSAEGVYTMRVWKSYLEGIEEIPLRYYDPTTEIEYTRFYYPVGISRRSLETALKETQETIGLFADLLDDSGESISSAKIIAAINGNTSEVTLSADKINLDGMVDSLNAKDAWIEKLAATSGTIGGWTISGTDISKVTGDLASGRTTMSISSSRGEFISGYRINVPTSDETSEENTTVIENSYGFLGGGSLLLRRDHRGTDVSEPIQYLFLDSRGFRTKVSYGESSLSSSDIYQVPLTIENFQNYISSEGNGWLASGGIRWDSEGNLRIGKNDDNIIMASSEGNLVISSVLDYFNFQHSGQSVVLSPNEVTIQSFVSHVGGRVSNKTKISTKEISISVADRNGVSGTSITPSKINTGILEVNALKYQGAKYAYQEDPDTWRDPVVRLVKTPIETPKGLYIGDSLDLTTFFTNKTFTFEGDLTGCTMDDLLAIPGFKFFVERDSEIYQVIVNKVSEGKYLFYYLGYAEGICEEGDSCILYSAIGTQTSGTITTTEIRNHRL